MAYEIRTFDLTAPQKIIPFLCTRLPLPQSEIIRLIDRGRVTVDGAAIVRKGEPVSGSVEVLFHVPSPTGLEPLFETPDFGVFDKPSGMLAHPNDFSVSASVMDEARGRYGYHSNTVHRLDRETSGLMVVSRHKEAESALKLLFQNRYVQKRYRMVLRGRLSEAITVEAPIVPGKKGHGQEFVKIFSHISPLGKPAKTHFIPLFYDAASDTTLTEAVPYTGRTHQIRVHAHHIGHTILGDPVYGLEKADIEAYLEGRWDEAHRLKLTGASRLMLHAYALRFEYRQCVYRLTAPSGLFGR